MTFSSHRIFVRLLITRSEALQMQVQLFQTFQEIMINGPDGSWDFLSLNIEPLG